MNKKIGAHQSVNVLVRAMMRAVRAIGYYDETHPVFARTQNEAVEALRAACDKMGDDVVLACGGSHIVYDVDAAPVSDDVCRSLAKCMFNRSLIAIHLNASVSPRDLGHLLRLLSEGEDRVRAGGGVKVILKKHGASNLEVVEVDYADLFAGNTSDVRAMIGANEVVERALREVLKHNNGAGGEVLSIKIEDMTSPASLGGFLDDLLARGDPSVRNDGTPPKPGDLPLEAVANAASEAYLKNAATMQAMGAPKADLAASARMLSKAMVRLSPSARLEFLQRVAGGEAPPSVGDAEAVTTLGEQLDPLAIVDAIASSLLDANAEDETVQAIGNLIRRLQPVEKDRHELLASVDAAMSHAGRKPHGAVWQEISARALGKEDLGYLKMTFDDVQPQLVFAVEQRRANKVPPVPGQEIIDANSEEAIHRHAARVLDGILNDRSAVGTTVVNTTRTLIERLEGAGDVELSTGLLAALVRRADREDLENPLSGRTRRNTRASSMTGISALEMPSEALGDEVETKSVRAVVSELLTGVSGQERATRLMNCGPGQGQLIAEVLLDGIAGTSDPRHQQSLLDKLAQVDPLTLERMGHLHAEQDPVRASFLIRAMAVQDNMQGLAMVRRLVRSSESGVRAAALKALVGLATDPRAIEQLLFGAGCRGEKAARAFYGIQPGDDDHLFQELQLTAIQCLGMTRSEGAVPGLRALLLQPSGFFANKEVEARRRAAAQALSTNNTEPALRVLGSATTHKKRHVRDAAKKAGGILHAA